MTIPRTHQPHWKDSTRTARSAKRTKQDDAWAAQVSGGKYPTLRRLMTAIHNGEVSISVFMIVKGHEVEASDNLDAWTARIQPEVSQMADALIDDIRKRKKQS